MKLIINRLTQSALVIIILSFLVFILIDLMPGTAITRLKMENPQLKKKDIVLLIKQQGLDRPTYIRYFYWLDKAMQGKLGYSITYHRPVTELIYSNLINTMKLTIPAFILSIFAALPLGIISAMKHNSKIDHSISTITFIALSIPSFLIGLILIYILSLKLKILPPGGSNPPYDKSIWNTIQHLIMPIIVLSSYEIGKWTRYFRGNLIDILKKNYINTAKAKGLHYNKVIIKHALKNAGLPFISLIGLSIPILFSGVLVTETIFGIHGMGLLLYSSIINKDTNLAMTAFLIISILTIIFNSIADILYSSLDPRIKINSQ